MMVGCTTAKPVPESFSPKRFDTALELKMIQGRAKFPEKGKGNKQSYMYTCLQEWASVFSTSL